MIKLSSKSSLMFLFGLTIVFLLCIFPNQPALASVGSDYTPMESPMIFGIPLDFILFAITLVGVALFHNKTLQVALTGLGTILIYKLFFVGFNDAPGFEGVVLHFQHEWVILVNLLGLLLGFSLLSNHFEQSHLPELLPKYLPSGWPGALVLLVMVFVLSSFLDNIAAALIGGTVANIVFKKKVHLGYIAAIVAASNAGGSGSVVGDTTTTMMWIAGISPIAVLHAYVAAFVALFVCGIPAAMQQNKYQPLSQVASIHASIDKTRLAIVFFILALAIIANVMANVVFVGLADNIPVLGLAVWIALLTSAWVRKPNWGLLPEAFKGSIFLLSLVTCASLMPVDKLPSPSWQSAMSLGFVSAVFDNIPLTALAIKQGGYDWGMLAYTVGFGGSMIWFGSSAGVAITSIFPEGKSALGWLKNGWHVTLAYIIGFFVLLFVLGWQPAAERKAIGINTPIHSETGSGVATH